MLNFWEKFKWRLPKNFARLVFFLEALLALFIISGVAISFLDLIRYLNLIISQPPLQTYEILRTFLGHILLLVIGLELVIMLVRHTPSSVVEVLLYAIARKIIMEAKTTLDVLIGVVALGGLFLLIKIYTPERLHAEKGAIVSSSMPIWEVNEIANVNIPENMANTIGGLISILASNEGKNIAIGQVFRINDAEISIYSMEGNLVRSVFVKRSEEANEVHC
ncbi:MAG: hypothetical protein XD49_1428 [Caldanaerobacter subterraneus]|uniref:Transporter-associated domain-containing protein n=3 Tax=Thermoanaerobacteraceae TaxID=186814 RepID=B0KD09_THEP3|nr:MULTISPECIES: transporter associated domain-containing protein [Thermoanaerobacteraceae]KUJ91772.1 MAG: hypothetical protein XD37_0208 [Thermoanaerobacter thermocopriae]ABY92220.1 hypothetical protein Teth514_0919 [Thermoanaerobacter sp. X514]ABY94107.1 hypothetical protein Teth39_0440 [Thermoanaerobacter pseudethanolicus ATCC 33223]ADV79063.1 hypothetical protein Thebr_0453 [Thermoanaerobacter brockii subsp. finnii Ako-1]KUK08524.1 MAG: hypothetical protein XD49_1428 [Caldanaerobacter subt